MRHRHGVWVLALLALGLPAPARADDEPRTWLALQAAAAVPYEPFRDAAEVGYGFTVGVQRFLTPRWSLGADLGGYRWRELDDRVFPDMAPGNFDYRAVQLGAHARWHVLGPAGEPHRWFVQAGAGSYQCTDEATVETGAWHKTVGHTIGVNVGGGVSLPLGRNTRLSTLVLVHRTWAHASQTGDRRFATLGTEFSFGVDR